uniref:Uncharacterized protein n=1 Tax=Anguilla anguilla TaxID=7936 RepID=A0A0E9TKV9_ANGAN
MCEMRKQLPVINPVIKLCPVTLYVQRKCLTYSPLLPGVFV